MLTALRRLCGHVVGGAERRRGPVEPADPLAHLAATGEPRGRRPVSEMGSLVAHTWSR